jgi:predicted dehydrogenase
MATFDDMDPERKITIYDKGFDESTAVDEDYVARSGDIWSPRVAGAEPLRLECEHFVDCVRTGREPISGARNGLAVVRVLEGLQASLDESRRQPAPQAVVSAERAAATTSSA